MFTVEDDDAPRQTVTKLRTCPDCKVPMHIGQDGEFGTLYICPKCQIHLRVPPKAPPSDLA